MLEYAPSPSGADLQLPGIRPVGDAYPDFAVAPQLIVVVQLGCGNVFHVGPGGGNALAVCREADGGVFPCRAEVAAADGNQLANRRILGGNRFYDRLRHLGVGAECHGNA